MYDNLYLHGFEDSEAVSGECAYVCFNGLPPLPGAFFPFLLRRKGIVKKQALFLVSFSFLGCSVILYKSGAVGTNLHYIILCAVIHQCILRLSPRGRLFTCFVL